MRSKTLEDTKDSKNQGGHKTKYNTHFHVFRGRTLLLPKIGTPLLKLHSALHSIPQNLSLNTQRFSVNQAKSQQPKNNEGKLESTLRRSGRLPL